MLFLGVGFAKSSSDSYWVRLFADIGLGDWFRFLTGALQVAGGLLFLLPRTVYPAAMLAGSTMIGAVVVHMLVLDGNWRRDLPAGLARLHLSGCDTSSRVGDPSTGSYRSALACLQRQEYKSARVVPVGYSRRRANARGPNPSLGRRSGPESGFSQTTP